MSTKFKKYVPDNTAEQLELLRSAKYFMAKPERIEPIVNIEKSILGYMLVYANAGANHKIFDAISKDSFYHEPHRLIFQIALSLHNRAVPIDIAGVTIEAHRNKVLTDIGGALFISDIAESAATSQTQLLAHVETLRTETARRNTIDTLLLAATDLLNTDDVVSVTNATLGALEHSISDAHVFDPEQQQTDAFERLKDKIAGRIKIQKLTGMPEMDKIIAIPENEGSVVVVYGKTGAGKSAFQNVVANYLSTNGVKYWANSSETASFILAAKLVAASPELANADVLNCFGKPASFSDINKSVKYDGTPVFDDEAQQKLLNVFDAVNKKAGKQTSVTGLSVDKYLSMCLEEIGRGTKVFLFDRLELFTDERTASGIDRIMEKIRTFCVKYGVIIILFAQLSRGDAESMMERLRGSEGIAQNAMVCVGVKREFTPVEVGSKALYRAWFDIDKNSYGVSGINTGHPESTDDNEPKYWFDPHRQLFVQEGFDYTKDPFEDYTPAPSPIITRPNRTFDAPTPPPFDDVPF